MAELQHYVQRETDALVVANDVAERLEAVASPDHQAAAEVDLDGAPFHSSSRDSARILVSFLKKKIAEISVFRLPEEK